MKKLFNTILNTIKSSCYGNNKISSKRIIMYTFTFIASMMIHTEAAYNLLLIYRCYSTDLTCEFKMVFNPVIYGYVFGIIAALAGINGFSKQDTTKEENVITN